MTIVTKTGDKGETGLFGGQRTSKTDVRIQTYGTVDELNAVLGLVLTENELSLQTYEQLGHIQNMLFRMGADLATPLTSKAHPPRIEKRHIEQLETWITSSENSIEMPQFFVLPGGSRTAALLHLARTVCRRTERLAAELAQSQDIGEHIVIYLNRLSDYLFIASLDANRVTDTPNVRVRYDDAEA